MLATGLDESWTDHSCLRLTTGLNESWTDHFCLRLTTGLDESWTDHFCLRLICAKNFILQGILTNGQKSYSSIRYNCLDLRCCLGLNLYWKFYVRCYLEIVIKVPRFSKFNNKT